MRLIDADVLEPHEQFEPMENGEYEYVEVVYKDDIDDTPTIDAVEVIRCNDCRHKTECHKSVQYTRNELNAVTIGYSPIEWCSHGERSEE